VSDAPTLAPQAAASRQAPALGPDVLAIDLAAEADRIAASLRQSLRTMKRRGLVIAMSGGIDSSTCAALAVHALGPDKVFGMMLPEQDSSDFSLKRGRALAESLGIQYVVENITPALEGLGCYARRDEAVRRVIPAYGPGWKMKIAIAGGQDGSFNYFRLVAQAPDGTMHDERLPAKDYLQIVAATNFKQRVRKNFEYYHADRLNYAVIGTPNRLEYDQGFFVKNGDGAADVKPIAHLYKTQVYAMAKHLGCSEEITSATPTTDTYTLAQGQDEFYFALPWNRMDLALWAHNHGLPAAELARALGIDVAHAEFVYRDIAAKRASTRYMHAAPVLVEPVSEIDA
jgi:NAD+ synthase